MTKNDNRKKGNNAKKIIPAAGMLALSASMLATSTYAWFTMNKEVSVTGMQVKAQAEEGLLINEVLASRSDTWDDEATANTTPENIALRPASTSNLTNWWHANSKKSSDEAGIGELDDTVGADDAKYVSISPNATGINDYDPVKAEDAEGENISKATGNQKAETHVYYKNASFGNTANGYDNGEGYYVKYTYYLKSSGGAMNVSELQAKVSATKKDGDNGTSDNLDKALRVGVKYGNAYKIFAPLYTTLDAYGVTINTSGSSTSVKAYGTSEGESGFVTLNNMGEDDAYVTLPVPAVTDDGSPVEVYVWFEGEDENCKSDNITAALISYDITVKFNDKDPY
jgi:hypothetical protein